MDDLIEALTIFRKYSDDKHPTGCSHDILRVYVSPDGIVDDDMKRLDDLGFFVDDELGGDNFGSFRFGSA